MKKVELTRENAERALELFQDQSVFVNEECGEFVLSLLKSLVKEYHCKVASYFPLRIQETETGKEYVVISPDEIPNGVTFKVLQCNASLYEG